MRSLFRFLIGVLLVCTAQAGTNVVTTLDDSGAGSLRHAIASSAPGDTITFAVAGTITLTGGELVITNNLTIAGPGATDLAVSGNSASRVFHIDNPGATVTISGLTICNGKSADGIDGDPWSGGPALSPGGDGGGILSLGALILERCHVTGNNTGRGGGSSFTHDPTGHDGTAGGSGGGVFCSNNLTAIACTVSRNTAGDGGVGGDSWWGGYGTQGGNGGAGGGGGGIYALGAVSLVSCTFAANAAGNGGNAGYAGDYSGHGGGGGAGGGLARAAGGPPAAPGSRSAQGRLDFVMQVGGA